MDKLKTSKSGKDIIKYYEGLHDGNLKKIGLQPKKCPAGIWTVGWGYTLVNKSTGKWLRGREDYNLIEKQYPEYSNMTIQEADDLLEKVLIKYEKIVNDKIRVTISQNKFDALVSHTYNTGGSDTLFKLVNDGNIEGAARWIESRYITSGGRVLPGLVKRRKAESVLFLKN